MPRPMPRLMPHPMPRLGVLAVAAALVAVPTSMLVARWATEGLRPVSELPASFQMYSSTAVPTYTGVDARGRVRPLDVGGLPPVVRAVGTGRTVPDRLCARHPELVEVRRDGGPRPGAYRC